MMDENAMSLAHFGPKLVMLLLVVQQETLSITVAVFFVTTTGPGAVAQGHTQNAPSRTFCMALLNLFMLKMCERLFLVHPSVLM